MDGQQFQRPPAEAARSGPAQRAPTAAARSSATAGRPAERPPVHRDVAAIVIGRAAELEQDRATWGAGGLDERALVEIGRDVGLSAAAVRQALDEYHAGLLQPAAAERQTVVGPRSLVIERTVPGSIERVDAELTAFLTGKLFECCRRVEHRTVWRPREGLLASLQRFGKRFGKGDRTLEDVTEITMVLVALPAGDGRGPQVRVRLEAECASLRRGMVATAVGGVAVGGAGVAATAGAALLTGDPLPLLGLPPLGALAAGSYLGPRQVYRRKLSEVELVLQGGLDQLVLGTART